ncbi:MAG: protein kinase [Lentisphaeria bacterium]|nr:protein kinase [Lentisphaeria bacterium]
MDTETQNVVPDDSVDKTIVIPRTDVAPPGRNDAVPDDSVDKTIVIPRTDAAPPPVRNTTLDTIVSGEKASILSDLGNFLFLRHRTVVDDTIELAGGETKDAPAGESAGREFTAKLVDVLDHYSLAAKPFASGGQGSVSKAMDLALGCEIAVKSLHRRLCGDDLARDAFLTEARLTASLDHPSIIPIHGMFGDAGNGMHLAMKLIEGHTLSAYLKSIVDTYTKQGIRRFDEHKSLRNRIEIFLRVCDALEYAHSRNIIHRDLKLENIMIGRHRETYVTDWGLAMRLSDRDGVLKKVNGTPGFIAPEVLTTHKADTRSDIYSLGAILFELVTLTPAFGDRDLAMLLQRVRQGAHAPLRHRFRCRIDADLKAIILKAIAVDPAKRYQKVSDLSEDLRRYLTHEETSARPDNLFSKLCRWGVNHRRGMLLTTLLVMLLGLGGIARTLHREKVWSTEKRLRDNAIGSVYSAVIGTANQLEKNMERIEYQVEQLRMNVLFSALKVDTPRAGKRNFFVPMSVYQTHPPASFVNSAAYRHSIDPNGACVFNANGGEVDMEQLRYFANTGEYMREAILDTQKVGESEAVARLVRSGRPVKKIYFTLTDGTFACYPGSRDDFPPGYSPQKRIWYQRAIQSPGRVVWSGPYQDSGVHKESVITCSTTVHGADGKFIGVAAIDFSLTKLAEQLLGPDSKCARGTVEKLLIHPSGKIIFRMIPPGRRSAAPFSDPALIQRMAAMKYGTLLTEKNGREMLLAFSYLESIDVLYVEYLDLLLFTGKERQRAAAK